MILPASNSELLNVLPCSPFAFLLSRRLFIHPEMVPDILWFVSFELALAFPPRDLQNKFSKSSVPCRFCMIFSSGYPLLSHSGKRNLVERTTPKIVYYCSSESEEQGCSSELSGEQLTLSYLLNPAVLFGDFRRALRRSHSPFVAKYRSLVSFLHTEIAVSLFGDWRSTERRS